MKSISIYIDKLTNSIENSLTGEVFDTEIVRLLEKDKGLIDEKEWNFNWKNEIEDIKSEVYKLSTVNNPSIIQGLLSIEDKTDHIFMRLIESSGFNLGKNKIYLGVPGNLVAYACKISFEKGYEGFVAFDAKTNLIEHYKKILGATHFRGQRMFIETNAAKHLVSLYFKK